MDLYLTPLQLQSLTRVILLSFVEVTLMDPAFMWEKCIPQYQVNSTKKQWCKHYLTFVKQCSESLVRSPLLLRDKQGKERGRHLSIFLQKLFSGLGVYCQSFWLCSYLAWPCSDCFSLLSGSLSGSLGVLFRELLWRAVLLLLLLRSFPSFHSCGVCSDFFTKQLLLLKWKPMPFLKVVKMVNYQTQNKDKSVPLYVFPSSSMSFCKLNKKIGL